MKLRYINIVLDEHIEDSNYRSIFEFHARFVCHYFTKRTRKLAIETGGEFNLLCIKVGSNLAPYIDIPEVLVVGVPFEKNLYDSIKGSANASYYVNLIRLALTRLNGLFSFPIEEMETIISEFEKDKYTNVWTFKNKRFNDIGIRANFTCIFDTNKFALRAVFSDLSTKDQLCSGDVITTKPDEVYFSHVFKDVVVKDNDIVITDYGDHDLLHLSLNDIRNRKISKKFCECPWKNNTMAINNWNLIIQELQFNGNRY